MTPMHTFICPAFNSARRPGIHPRSGSMLIYALFLMVILLAMTSLCMDYGRMQMIKTQLQRDADATARGAVQMYVTDGPSTASWVAPAMAANQYNTVDANSGLPATVNVTWGWWNKTTKTFTAGSGTPVAAMVVVSRTKAANNAVPLTFPLMQGLTALLTSCDISATAIAYVNNSTSATVSVPGTADVWLAGMPSGTTASCWDSTSSASPVMAMNVTPGAVMTFSATGLTNDNGSTAILGADGASYNTTHMAGSPDGNYNGLQNGIQTLTAPQNALIGVFLTNAAPNTQTPPATALSYTTSTLNQANYTNVQLQQPFFIGNGQTGSGVTQSFIVPPGATRLYLGVFDGWYNADNSGSLSVSAVQQPQVHLVR